MTFASRQAASHSPVQPAELGPGTAPCRAELPRMEPCAERWRGVGRMTWGATASPPVAVSGFGQRMGPNRAEGGAERRPLECWFGPFRLVRAFARRRSRVVTRAALASAPQRFAQVPTVPSRPRPRGGRSSRVWGRTHTDPRRMGPNRAEGVVGVGVLHRAAGPRRLAVQAHPFPACAHAGDPRGRRRLRPTRAGGVVRSADSPLRAST